MKAIFTIVAKNYLPRAITLGDSIRRHHPDMPFYIFLADEMDQVIAPSEVKYPLIESRSIGIPQFRDMSFYYTILELCCAIKPFCISYLEARYGYGQIVYFDPDIYIYSNLDSIFSSLSSHAVIITPHLTDLDQAGVGATPETMLLFVGAYNLGFIAVALNEETRRFVRWWGDRLVDRAFVDFRESLHVDQKWIDLIPGMLGEQVLIERDPGYNVAQWNMHERQLSILNGKYLMNGRPLIFFHHTSFDPHKPERLAHRQTKFSLENRPEFRAMMCDYAEALIANGYDKYIGYQYTYKSFENGYNIFSFQRRLYRVVVKSRKVALSPFAVGPGTFYALLDQNGLVIPEKARSEFVQADFKSAPIGVRYMHCILRVLRRLIGIKRYYLLMRWLQNNTRPEEQMFLLTRGLSEIE